MCKLNVLYPLSHQQTKLFKRWVNTAFGRAGCSNQPSVAGCGSHSPPGVWISDHAEWHNCTLCLAVMRTEMGHEDALFWPGACPYPAWPMTSSLKRPRQTACSQWEASEWLLATGGSADCLPLEHGTLLCACDSWQMEVKWDRNCCAYETMWRLPIP